LIQDEESVVEEDLQETLNPKTPGPLESADEDKS
jgi:hypothetical protein